MVILEWIGKRHERDVLRWQTRADAQSTLDAAVAMAGLDLTRRRDELSKVKGEIDDHAAYVEDRVFRSLAIDELIKAATTAVRDGYNAGIAKTRGETRGARR
jgi:hypothetical protein